MIRSDRFSISRSQLVRIASVRYLRRLWPVFVAFPVFGVVALILGPSPLIRAVGFFAILWPLSVPARVALGSWTKARKLMEKTWVGLDDGVLYFHGETGGMKLPLDQVRRAEIHDGVYVFETRMYNFALVPVSSIPEPEREEFERQTGVSGR